MNVLIIIVSLVLVAMAGILLSNTFLFPRLRQFPPASPLPRVSVLIPARDEAAVIKGTLARLDAQDYPDFEVLVLDDHSSDSTAELARSVGGHVRVIAGAALPDGWSGKNWACHQLSQVATGEVLLFTDADVIWQPGALSALVAEFQRTRADLLTVWPTQITVTLPERLIVPLMAMVVMAYLPVVAVHYLPFALFGASNGQCMAWRCGAYQRTGGHQAVRHTVLEDVTLARIVKRLGLRLRMADGASLIGCRMYTDWGSVRDGYSKNIMAGFGGVIPLLASIVFHWLMFLFPIVLLQDARYGKYGLPLVALGVLIRALSAAATRQRIFDAILLPISVLLMTRISAHSLYWRVHLGGPQWKGRVLSRAGQTHV